VDWPGLFRRYVWHEERTPYLVRAERLTPGQARSELFVYGLLLATPASLVAVISALDLTGGSTFALSGVALYAVALALAAVALGASGHPLAAWFCATAPLLMEVGILAGLLRPGTSPNERIALLALGALWLAYALRVVRIAHRLRARA
jgi:hypothetical protein